MPAMRSFSPTLIDRTKRELCGIVAQVVYHDPSGGFFTAKLRTGESVVGNVDENGLDPGTTYRFLGRWTEHARYGPQFQFDSLVEDTPADRAGVVQYLARMVRSITQAKAERLYDAYGEETIAVLRGDAVRVAEDGFMSPWAAAEVAKQLTALHATERTTIDLFSLFAGKGFPRTAIKQCVGRFGARAAQIVRADPFKMLTADIAGVGFRRADKLYLELGLPPARLKRQMLAAWSALHDDSNGHTWSIEGAARKAILAAVGAGAARFKDAIAMGIRARWLATREDSRLWITERSKAAAEERCALQLYRLMQGRPVLWPAIPDSSAVSAHQREKVTPLLASPVAILSGSPGTGKTFVAAAILREVVAQIGRQDVCVVAPTGKAAVRIAEAMSRYGLGLEATTIHRRLEIGRNGHDGKGWGFQRHEGNPLPHRFIVADEMSMTDVELAADLFAACPTGSHVLLIGDIGQLPPVGHGAPLRDMIDAGVPTAMLTEIQRNSGLIVHACTAIKGGKRFTTCEKLDPDSGQNLRFIETEDADAQVDMLRKIVEAIQSSGKHDPVWDVQVLVAMNDSSTVSRLPLNALLQGILNPPADAASAARQFRASDKIICLRNSFMNSYVVCEHSPPDDTDSYMKLHAENGAAVEVYVANGDQGRVLAVDDKRAVAQFDGPTRVVTIQLRKPGKGEGEAENAEGGTGGDFSLAYAITVHKSQGSEWPVAIVMVDEQAGAVASKEHHYTALSRASKICIVIGKRSVMQRQCGKSALKVRKTFLVELIRELTAGEGDAEGAK